MRSTNTARKTRENHRRIALVEAEQPAITIAEYLSSEQAPWMWDKAEGTRKKRRWSIQKHIVPHLGDRQVFDLTRQEVLEWHHRLAKDASNYIARDALNMLHMTFRHLFFQFEGQIPQKWTDPTAIPTSYRAKEDPRNKGRVQYMSLEEGARFIWSPEIEFSRRVLYAILAYTGMRIGEASALTWADYTPDKQPLGELSVHKSFSGGVLNPQTKTGAAKLIPVHPNLAGLLDVWRSQAWEDAFGRSPSPEDIIVPRRVRGKIRHMGAKAARERWMVDRRKLGLDPMKTTIHGWRGAFMSWAEAGGVRREIIKRLTHTGRQDVVDGYITKAWPQLCEVVMAIDLPMPDEERPTYDIHGYDADGFNAEGVDRQGYDREGFNAEGYDRQGYDRQGFNRAGLDRIGLHLGVQGCLFGDLEPTTKPQTTTPHKAKEKTK